MGIEPNIRTGELIHYWRQIRGFSQAELAERCATSQRNLSFIENSRKLPSESLIEALCVALEIPARERLMLLRSAGLGRVYEPVDLSREELAQLRFVLEATIERLDPYPAIVMNRQFDFLISNRAMQAFVAWIMGDSGKVVSENQNMLELLLSPKGMQPYLSNWAEIAAGAMSRLYRDAVLDDPDGTMTVLLERMLSIEGMPTDYYAPGPGGANPLVRLCFDKNGESLEFDTLISTVGTPTDVTYQEVRIRYFVPVDQATESAVERIVSAHVSRLAQ